MQYSYTIIIWNQVSFIINKELLKVENFKLSLTYEICTRINELTTTFIDIVTNKLPIIRMQPILMNIQKFNFNKFTP